MYSILLVDDEILELETLRDFVDWQSMGIKVIGTARNGRSALEKARELKPDIIITDVRMPIMDGIEFSRNFREFNKTTKLIFLTGYDDFNYVKSALQVSASNYILKPFTMEELNETIDKIIKELDSDKLSYSSVKVYIENRLKYLLSLATKEEAAKIVEELKTAGKHDLTSFNYNLMIAYCDIKTAEKWKDIVSSIDADGQVILENSHCTILLNSDKLKANGLNIKGFAEELRNKALEAGSEYADILYSDKELTFQVLREEYKRLVEHRDEIFFYCKNNCVLNSSLLNDYPGEDIKLDSIENRLTEAIFGYDKEKVKLVLEEYFNFAIRNKIRKSIVMESTFNILLFLWEEFFRHNPEIALDSIGKNELWNKLISCRNIYSMLKFTLSQTDKISEYLIVKHKDKNQYVVDKIIKFVENNFHKQITINDVAANVYLSPNYVRNIFKEKTGETFLEYLTDYRLKKAAELLKDKSLKVYEVSNMVSYENVSYFCSIFAKSYGVSPNEYRNKY